MGGTSESAQLATAIAQAKLACTISVTTVAATALYPAAPELQVVVRTFNFDQLLQFLQADRIVKILDASHPYAVEISQLAIAAARQLQIPYLRFERPVGSSPRYSCCPTISLDSLDALFTGDYLQNQRVLLTIGYKFLAQFAAWQNRATLFARILPSSAALEAALAAGFQSKRLFAIRPPVPLELERALWQHWQISLAVTKASGQPGGEDTKRTVAAELGVPLIVITRPRLLYPRQTSDLSTALEFCHQQA